VQTLGAAMPLWSSPRRFAVASRTRLRVPLPDGGSLLGDAWWAAGAAPKPLALLLHGLGGSSESKYMVRAAVALHRRGVHVVRMNLRGAGEGVTEASSLWHAGLTSDVLAAAGALAREPRVANVVLVGFSLGGNVALKLAGEIGADVARSPVRAVAALSAPLDLDAVARRLDRWRGLPYRAYVLRSAIAQARAFARAHAGATTLDARRLLRVTTMRGYDELVVAPMHGFASAADYYAAASAGPLLARVRLPTLLLHAEDDPIVPGDTVRPFLARAPLCVRVEVSRHGGHVAWLDGLREDAFVDTWGMRQVCDLVAG
jgi:predicted alpha/beta-fold hydrolase